MSVFNDLFFLYSKMASPVELLAVLEDLTDDEFKKFRWLLQLEEFVEGIPPIPKSQLEKADRMDTVDEMTKAFEKNITVVCIKVLKMIKQNNLAQRLLRINSTSKGKGLVIRCQVCNKEGKWLHCCVTMPATVKAIYPFVIALPHRISF